MKEFRKFRIVLDDLGGYAVQVRVCLFFWSYIFPPFGNHKSFKTIKEAERELKECIERRSK